MASTPKSARVAAKAALTKQALSPRGRGSVAPVSDPNWLLNVFAENVRLVRTARQLSQEATADLADIDRTYISSIERKLRNVSIRNIQRIAEALNVEPRVLLDPQLSRHRRIGVSKPLADATGKPVGGTNSGAV